jgi:hypothetical protein
MIEEILLKVFMRRLEIGVTEARSGKGNYFMIGCMGGQCPEWELTPGAAKCGCLENMVWTVLEKTFQECMQRIGRTARSSAVKPVTVKPLVLEGNDADFGAGCHEFKDTTTPGRRNAKPGQPV